jgi:hypothetical protein
MDAFHQVMALANAGAWLNDRAMAEWLEKRRAAYGPGGMPKPGARHDRARPDCREDRARRQGAHRSAARRLGQALRRMAYQSCDVHRPERYVRKNDIDRELAHADREIELARLITTTPAVFPWMIMCKIEVLEHYLGASDGAVWADKCEVVMLAGIKADLLRFEPKADNP